jgi:hypothetical protein
VVHLDDLCVSDRIFQAVTDNLEHIGRLTLNLQHHTGRVAGKLLAAHGGIPADDNPVTRLPRGRVIIDLEPIPFNEIAALGYRLDLVIPLSSPAFEDIATFSALAQAEWLAPAVTQRANSDRFAIEVP